MAGICPTTKNVILQTNTTPDAIAVEFNWTGDSIDGSVPNTKIDGGAMGIQGWVATHATINDGPIAPTAGYNVQLLNNANIDILGDAGTDIQDAAISITLGASIPPTYGTLTLVISDQSTPLAQGKIVVYFRRVSSMVLMTPAEATVSTGGSTSDYEYWDIRKYAFSYVSGQGRVIGSLASSGAKTLTLRPVPAGVNGSDLGHKLYISGGVGTAEVVSITGGTAISGAPVGTITFTTVNAHTGSWSLSTATGGAQECYQYQVTVGPDTSDVKIQFPVGDTTLWATLDCRDRGVKVFGYGPTMSYIRQRNLSSGAIRITNSTGLGYRASVAGLGFIPTGGVMGSSVSTIYVEEYPYGGVEDCLIVQPGLGVYWQNLTFGNPLIFSNIEILQAQSVGFRFNGNAVGGKTAGVLSNFYCDGVTCIALQIVGLASAWTMTNVWTQQTAIGIDLVATGTTPVAESIIQNFIVDQDDSATSQICGIRITGTGPTSSHGFTFNGGFIQTASPAIIITDFSYVTLSNTRMSCRGSSSMVILDGTSDCSFYDNDYMIANGAVTNAFVLQNTNSKTTIVGGNCSFLPGSGVGAGEFINTNASATDVFLSGIHQNGFNTTALEATAGTVRRSSNLTVLENPPALASAATVTLPSVDSSGLITMNNTNNISRMLGGWPGRTVYFNMAGALTFVTGGANPGNIAVATGPTTPGQLITAVYNSFDGKWYLS